jgi:uncharacterized protein YjbI with pentapeptide repeats
MRWLKRDLWKAGIAFAAMLLLLLAIAGLPVSAADTHEELAGLAGPGTVTAQGTLTEDTTVAALNKEKLALQVKQLPNQNSWLVNNSTALIAAFAAIVVALFGIYQWAVNRRDERRKEVEAQDKDLKAQAEERFKTAVTALGDEKEGTRVGGAILLRSFLNKKDMAIYDRYYAQIFDLAVAYLRLSSMSQLSEDQDRLPPPPSGPLAPLLLTPLRQALIVVFQEAFPLSRNRLGQIKSALEARSLDASYIRLDGAYLARVDLQYVWMRDASFIGANLHFTNLQGSDLIRANFHKADLEGAYLSNASLRRANLSETILMGVHLNGADLYGADLSEAKLYGADLSEAKLLYGADLSEANPRGTILKGTDLRGVKGMTKELLKACKAKGAIIDEDTNS